ncbi:MAG: diguanylate cyclase [Thermoleophilaceae bacterium]
MARRGRQGGRLSLVLLDLDGFKAVNDRLGHLAGDRALTNCAEALLESVRVPDTCFRARSGAESSRPSPNMLAARRLGAKPSFRGRRARRGPEPRGSGGGGGRRAAGGEARAVLHFLKCLSRVSRIGPAGASTATSFRPSATRRWSNCAA